MGGGYAVEDADGQRLAWFYGRPDAASARVARRLYTWLRNQVVPFDGLELTIVKTHKGVAIMQELVSHTRSTIDAVRHAVTGFHTAGA